VCLQPWLRILDKALSGYQFRDIVVYLPWASVTNKKGLYHWPGVAVFQNFFSVVIYCVGKSQSVSPFKAGLKFVSKPRAYQSEAPIHSHPHSQTLDKAKIGQGINTLPYSFETLATGKKVCKIDTGAFTIKLFALVNNFIVWQANEVCHC